MILKLSRAGADDLPTRFLDCYCPAVAVIAHRQGSILRTGVHMAIRAGRPGHRLLVCDADATSAGFDVVTQVVGVGKTEIAMALTTEQSRVSQDLILPGGRVEIGRFLGIVWVMTCGARDTRPLGEVGASRVGAELSIGRSEKITQGLACRHSTAS